MTTPESTECDFTSSSSEPNYYLVKFQDMFFERLRGDVKSLFTELAKDFEIGLDISNYHTFVPQIYKLNNLKQSTIERAIRDGTIDPVNPRTEFQDNDVFIFNIDVSLWDQKQMSGFYNLNWGLLLKVFQNLDKTVVGVVDNVLDTLLPDGTEIQDALSLQSSFKPEYSKPFVFLNIAHLAQAHNFEASQAILQLFVLAETKPSLLLIGNLGDLINQQIQSLLKIIVGSSFVSYIALQSLDPNPVEAIRDFFGILTESPSVLGLIVSSIEPAIAFIEEYLPSPLNKIISATLGPISQFALLNSSIFGPVIAVLTKTLNIVIGLIKGAYALLQSLINFFINIVQFIVNVPAMIWNNIPLLNAPLRIGIPPFEIGEIKIDLPGFDIGPENGLCDCKIPKIEFPKFPDMPDIPLLPEYDFFNNFRREISPIDLALIFWNKVQSKIANVQYNFSNPIILYSIFDTI